MKTLKDFLLQTNNQILLLFTVIYIILVLIVFYFNSFSWMQYKGDDKTSVPGILDKEEDKFRSVSVRNWNLFIKNKWFFYVIFILVGLLSLFSGWIINYYNYYKEVSIIPNNYIGLFLKVLLELGIVTAVVCMSFFLFSYTPTILTIIPNLLNILIIGGGLSLYAKQLKKKQSGIILGLMSSIISLFIGGWVSSIVFGILGAIVGYYLGIATPKSKNPPGEFLQAVITYLPCLFINLAIWIKNEFKLTTKKTYILLAIEILLIGLRFLLPFLYKSFGKLVIKQGNILLNDPISLHYPSVLGKYLSDIELKDKDFTKTTFMNYNYALSFWLWIIPQSESTNQSYNKNTEVLNLNEVIKVYYNKGTIEFWAATSNDKNTKQIMKKLYSLKEFEYQRWNNFIINYYGGTLDIFLDKTLISSIPNITPLNITHYASSGAPDGIYGGIKNVVYYKHTLTQRDINLIDTF